MIKQIIKTIKEYSEVYAYKIIETQTQSNQAFYILGKLDMTRLVNTTEYNITIYRKFDEYLGQSNFTISHKVSKSELKKLIEDTLFAAGFVKNKYYDLISGDKKRTFKEKPILDDPYQRIDEIAQCFNELAKPNVRFNALEIFYNNVKTNIVNSNNVNYTKLSQEIFVEAIPSFDGDTKVELYKNYHYSKFDLEQIKEDAKTAIEDVKARYEAQAINSTMPVDVILEGENCFSFFSNAINDYSYASVYYGECDKKIGDMVQDETAKEKISLSLSPISKTDRFDNDGTLISKYDVINDGKLVSYYGGNQYAYYLGMQAKGNCKKVLVNKGHTSYDKMTKRPFIKIIALSAIQIDTYSDYIGGEVRLALYYDGEKLTPVSGFSFSGSFKKALNNLVLSKETVDMKMYQGPRYIKLDKMEII